MHKAFLMGVLGDAGLQMLGTSISSEQWGLRDYFARHGPVESLFVAGGMVSAFWYVSTIYLGLDPYGSAFLGAVTDVAFRTWLPMKSLAGYYAYMPWWKSVFWAAFPAYLLALLVPF